MSAGSAPRRTPQRDRLQQRYAPEAPGPGTVPGPEYPPDTAHAESLVGCLAPAVAHAVVYEEGLGARGVDADTEAGDIVIPDNPLALRGFEYVDGSLGNLGRL